MASSFRPIQPAAQPPLLHHNSAGSRGAVASWEKLGKRIRSVGQACQECRQNKVKCDGRRLQCSTCIARGRSCRYEPQAGQSRKAALKSRLQALERLFGELQAKPAQEADRLLQQIRSADDFRSLLDLKEKISPPGASSSTSISPGASSLSSPTAGSGSDEQSVGSVTPLRESIVSRLLQESHIGDGALRTAQVPTPSSTAKELPADASTFLISLVLPSASITQAAVGSFFRSSGKLFHVFSREQVSGYYDHVFGSDGCSIPNKKTAICCLAAVAAVGVQYSAEDFEVGMDGAFYDVARHFLENVIEEQPLDAIKGCALLAMYNIMNKAMVSLAYIEVGLGMSKRHNLSDKCYHYPGLSPEQWIDYRRTWRTLLFFSSWLSSTLGYISGGDISFREVVSLVDVEGDHSSDISHIVQTEMTKIALLNADILRMHLSSEEMTCQAMDSISKDLQDWHNRLPSEMQLANLCREDLPVEARRSILGTHLLYLGTRMLLYRRIASQFVRSSRISHGNNILWEPLEDRFLSHADQAVTAAKHSARILGLLRAEKGIFKRCWLVIFQSYTSCIVLLHCVAQKQVHSFPRSSWEGDLAQARICLDVLSFCSTTDSVALKFQDCVVPIYDKLASYIFPTATTNTPPNLSTLAYLLRVPTTADPDRLGLSLELLIMLCQPFANVNGKSGSNDNLSTPWQSFLAQSKQLQGGERLDWKLESCQPFRWDAQDLEICETVFLESYNRFLGSDQPSGWAGVGSEDGWEELEWVTS
ncbi:hypothetical protein B0J13DRAFT_571537 [Dactylonectria estremocensis]|uniref:Zn(2)-C6 fungal-type domain-containing protein n=1 Tax=Dactylonectria estremocensis TaxID=1079267 RepID=A0A9P9DCY0_9HYPO|nr:hypothetical protein B0J13DRAFT_571537 [Dactylonectria estremocensis]